jgi:hypothetical protein
MLHTRVCIALLSLWVVKYSKQVLMDYKLKYFTTPKIASMPELYNLREVSLLV